MTDSAAASRAYDAGPVTIEITNKRGLHARASAKFVNIAMTFDADVVVIHDGSHAAGTDIMELMLLAAGIGDSITIAAIGPDAAAVVAKLAALVRDRFGED